MTTEEKIQELEILVKDPRTPFDERLLFQKTISKLKGWNPPQQAPPAQNAYEVRVPEHSRAPEFVAPPPFVQVHIAPEQPKQIGTVQIERTPAQNTVAIKWTDKPTETHTEGTCRGMFVTRFKEAAASKMAKAGRAEDLRNTKTFFRAVAYYRGLCIFFRHAPTLAELDIRKPSAQQQAVFDLIQKEAI